MCKSTKPNDTPIIYYLAPDFDIPSWGNATLYIHSELLKQSGINSYVLHHNRPYRYTWLKSNAEILYLDDPNLNIKEKDVLIVPEVNALDDVALKINCRKILFVQNAFLIIAKLEKAYDFSEIGYESCIVTQPHMKKAVERYFGLHAEITPHTIPSYFFSTEEDINTFERKKQIVLFPKHVYELYNHIDYQILKKMLYRKLYKNYDNPETLKYEKRGEWDLIELKDKTHEEVAEIMKESAFYVCVNTLEGFNVTVPEAMASGCIPICYDAYGGKDYLIDRVNAYSYPNNHIFKLIDKLFELMDNYDQLKPELEVIRQNGLKSARNHKDNKISDIVSSHFQHLLQNSI